MRRQPGPDGLPILARLIVAASATSDVRDAVLGDLQEEYARRTRADPTSAAIWLWGQVLASLGPWVRYRLPRSTRARAALGVLAGVIAVQAIMGVLNTTTVLDLVRSIPADARATFARGLNWGAVVAAAFLAARVTKAPPRGFSLALSGAMLAVWSVSWGWALGSAPVVPGVIPAVPLMVAAWVGVLLGSPRGASA